MPVTINGDGSITGLSVGGLGSGVVNDTTLASNAVTTAKIASGAATQAKRTYASGEIVKVQSFKASTADQQGTTNTDVVLESFTFTTALSNSRLLIHYHSGQIKRHAQDMNGWIWTSVDSTNRHGNMFHYVDHNHHFYGHQTSLSNDHRAFNTGFDVSNQLSAGSHTVRVGCYSYNGVATFNYQGSDAGRRFSVIVMEVAS
tara:strand:- start:114 stop:716 length:603 start_codon:yes stop_codon:yes gene_type:complete